MEGSRGDSKSPFHSLHHLPRLPPWVPVSVWYRHRHPQGQAITTACGLEGGIPLHDLIGPAQGVQSLVQVQVPGNPGGVQHRAPGQNPTKTILSPSDYGGAGGRLLRDIFLGRDRGDAERPAVPHHL